MPDYILHHYDEAPFAEKIRLVFGIKNLEWFSVIQPATMPTWWLSNIPIPNNPHWVSAPATATGVPGRRPVSISPFGVTYPTIVPALTNGIGLFFLFPTRQIMQGFMDQGQIQYLKRQIVPFRVEGGGEGGGGCRGA